MNWLTLVRVGWDLGWLFQMRERLLFKIILLWLLNSLIVGTLILIEIICSRCLGMLLQGRLKFSHWSTRISNELKLKLNVRLLLTLYSRIRCNRCRPVQEISSVTDHWRSQRRETTAACWRVLDILCNCSIPCKLWLFAIFKRLLYEVKAFLWYMPSQWTTLILTLADWASNFILRYWGRSYDKVCTACETIKSPWYET